MTEKSTFDLFNEMKLLYLLYLSIPDKKLSIFEMKDPVIVLARIQNIQSKLIWTADGNILMYINNKCDDKVFESKKYFGLSSLEVFDSTL